MHEIKCPNCKTVFKVDETSYAAIIQQVKNSEFNEELHERISQLKKEHQNSIKIIKEKLDAELQNELIKKDKEISNLKTNLDVKTAEITAQKVAEIAQITSQKDSELAKKNQEISLLKSKYENIAKELEAEKEAALAQLESSKNDEINKLKLSSSEKLINLETQLKNSETEKQLAISKAVAPIEKERDQLKHTLETKDIEGANREQTMKEKYESFLRFKDEEIERLKDMRDRQSTKMLGESLEKHCENEFNKLRATAFKNAEFKKDNDDSSGSKGDYIYCEKDENGTEIISIMFEMKNENDATATKHKNEDFFKKLDKDRKEKGCEYAVLVSWLEKDNDFYNTGIADVSWRYPKMYVIRPQFFVPMISLLRNAALNSLQYKNELIKVQNQDIDVANFENDMNEWKTKWFTTMKNAGKKHKEALDQINKAIKDLEKTRDALILSDKHLASAENKMDELTIKKLTRGNPTMAKKFADLKESKS